jgi:hypothetical protein
MIKSTSNRLTNAACIIASAATSLITGCDNNPGGQKSVEDNGALKAPLNVRGGQVAPHDENLVMPKPSSAALQLRSEDTKSIMPTDMHFTEGTFKCPDGTVLHGHFGTIQTKPSISDRVMPFTTAKTFFFFDLQQCSSSNRISFDSVPQAVGAARKLFPHMEPASSRDLHKILKKDGSLSGIDIVMVESANYYYFVPGNDNRRSIRIGDESKISPTVRANLGELITKEAVIQQAPAPSYVAGFVVQERQERAPNPNKL